MPPQAVEARDTDETPAAVIAAIDAAAARGAGIVVGPLTRDAVDAVADDPRFRHDFSVVFDIRAGRYAGELGDGDAFVAVLKRRRDAFQGRFALLVPESLQFLGKLYCVLAAAGGFDRMQCFTDGREACRWCGAPEE